MKTHSFIWALKRVLREGKTVRRLAWKLPARFSPDGFFNTFNHKTDINHNDIIAKDWVNYEAE